MTPDDLDELIAQYAAGIEAEIRLLERLEAASTQQRAASHSQNLDTFNEVTEQRDRLTAALAAIEQPLTDVRRALSEARAEARQRPGYERAVSLHRDAIALLARILEIDKASLERFSMAVATRREALRALDLGESTLAAYRKVMTLPPGATLVDRRG